MNRRAPCAACTPVSQCFRLPPSAFILAFSLLLDSKQRFKLYDLKHSTEYVSLCTVSFAVYTLLLIRAHDLTVWPNCNIRFDRNGRSKHKENPAEAGYVFRSRRRFSHLSERILFRLDKNVGCISDRILLNP